MKENYRDAACYNRDVITTVDKPFNTATGLAILHGNVCENGAVIKPSAASEHLMQHTGKAVVFENIEDYKEVKSVKCSFRYSSKVTRFSGQKGKLL